MVGENAFKPGAYRVSVSSHRVRGTALAALSSSLQGLEGCSWCEQFRHGRVEIGLCLFGVIASGTHEIQMCQWEACARMNGV